MAKIVYISGGQRSGKSQFAEEFVLHASSHPVYVATARVLDDDFRERVRIHQDRRGPQWTNIEEPLYLGRLRLDHRVVLVDCLTLWTTNFFFDKGEDCIEEAFECIKSELDIFLQSSGAQMIVFVSNEIGLGGTSPNRMQRKFADLLGLVNQYVAKQSDEAYLCISGIPVRIK
ncbi:MAG: bifunctional adenosylcobinamide kinase/adenosylcobinamide-phosphate guanylyltransferase [Porphyromonadaceae bacterium]|nr:bifunctional adenosylcobinamide kinase/adenosylcobinamide-phosphate guanylyltransferase [Porphyromonadaceae bacterium]